MLSILIPTYNYDISGLVSDLHQQASETGCVFEIMVLEDGSSVFVKDNASVCQLSSCYHFVNEKNSGRSVVRNHLGSIAHYNHLLFIDCDAKVCSRDFISRYLAFCNEDVIVIGGTTYEKDNHDPNYSLRLKYGRKREANSDYFRHEKYNNFATFNFLISRKIFTEVQFDETIRGYGHEDTLFGHCLHESGYEFIRIDNPLIHNGLDDNRLFLKKTEESVVNLFRLYETGKYPFLVDESKLLNYYVWLKKFNLLSVMKFKFRMFRRIIEQQLCSANPSLLMYDLYKLFILISAGKN